MTGRKKEPTLANCNDSWMKRCLRLRKKPRSGDKTFTYFYKHCDLGGIIIIHISKEQTPPPKKKKKKKKLKQSILGK